MGTSKISCFPPVKRSTTTAMKFLIAAAFLLPFVSSKYVASSLPDNCDYFTVGNCDPSKDEVIESYPIPNVENAVSLCQEGCNFFKYNAQETKCDLFHYRYLDSCQLVGGTATPTLDTCAQGLNNTCNSFVREDCTYGGEMVFNRTSVTDSHSCQELLATIGFVYQAEYFVYDSEKHICDFFTKKESECVTLSGPVLPDFDDCRTATTAATTVDPTAPT